MAFEILNNGDTGLVQRNKINNNFTNITPESIGAPTIEQVQDIVSNLTPENLGVPSKTEYDNFTEKRNAITYTSPTQIGLSEEQDLLTIVRTMENNSTMYLSVYSNGDNEADFMNKAGLCVINKFKNEEAIITFHQENAEYSFRRMYVATSSTPLKEWSANNPQMSSGYYTGTALSSSSEELFVETDYAPFSITLSAYGDFFYGYDDNEKIRYGGMTVRGREMLGGAIRLADNGFYVKNTSSAHLNKVDLEYYYIIEYTR